MSDLYGEFDDSDDMEDNDEEIGALGSILSWDDEDDAGVSDAVTAALEEQSALSKLPPFQYPQQVSIIGMQGVGSTTTAQPVQHQPQQQQPVQQVAQQQQQAQQPVQQQQVQQPQQQYQMIMQGYRIPIQGTGQTQQQQQQPQLTMTQGQAQQQLVQQVHMQPGQTYVQSQQGQQQQMMAQQMAGTQQQGVTVQQSAQQQQQMQQGRQVMTTAGAQARAPAYIYQQQMFPTGEQLSLPPNVMMQSSQQQDPNAFLRQMQIQYQRVPGTGSATLQHAPVIMQQAPMMAAPMQQAAAPVRKAQVKRKTTTDIKPPAAVKSNVVSCSDTDGESKINIQPSSKKASKKQKIAEDKSLEDMSPAEKAKANRDRNREHARNTRLRKKAYLEKLKSTVDELCRERDTLVSERAGASNLLVEMHNTRTEVLMSYFALRSGYERKREMWASILDDSCFTCVTPVTPYRSFPASEVQVSNCQRTIMGIDGMMADTASLHVLLNSLVDRSRYPTARIQFRFTLVTEDAVVAGNQMMSRWVMTTVNAMQLGARMEVAKQGMLCCKFNSAHKIISLEIMFDVMAFMLQLKQAEGSPEFTVVPNTVQTCQKQSKFPMVMTLAERPYTIVQVNEHWEELTGFKAEDVVGKASCRILQGQDTDLSAVSMLMSEVRYKRPASAVLLNYTKEGKQFRNYMNVYPLSTDSKITHYVSFSTHKDFIEDSSISSSSTQGVVSQGTGATDVAVKRGPQMIQAPTQHMVMQAQVAINQAGMGVPMTSNNPMAFYAAQQQHKQHQQQLYTKPAVGAPQYQIIQPIVTAPVLSQVATTTTTTTEAVPHPQAAAVAENGK